MNDSQHIQDSSLINEDLAPIAQEKRKWGTWNYAALWISMSLCIPTYLLASGMIKDGLNWWQAILIFFLGNCIVLIPMILNGHAGAKYGIPFPVLVRSSFGTKGANIPAILRALVACGWFGIQTWIGGKSIYNLIRAWNPSLAEIDAHSLFPQALPMICFLAFWLLNMYVIYLGVESIRKLLVFKAIFLPLATFALLFWA
jgi:NCS1 family nucleobase:cation symporter-1